MKVVGLTGTIGSGKEIAKDFFIKRFNCSYVTLSDVIRGEMERKKRGFNRKNLQDLGNELRKKYGTHILAMLSIEYLSREKELIIIDGIRNPGEGEFLRKKFGKNFVWIGIDAPRELRFERAAKRGKLSDPKTFEEFVAMDERDLGKDEPEYGQQVKACLERADFLLINDGTIEEFENKLSETVNQFRSQD